MSSTVADNVSTPDPLAGPAGEGDGVRTAPGVGAAAEGGNENDLGPDVEVSAAAPTGDTGANSSTDQVDAADRAESGEVRRGTDRVDSAGRAESGEVRSGTDRVDAADRAEEPAEKSGHDRTGGAGKGLVRTGASAFGALGAPSRIATGTGTGTGSGSGAGTGTGTGSDARSGAGAGAGSRTGAGSGAIGAVAGPAGVDAVSTVGAMGAIAETLECLNRVQTWQLSGPDVQNTLELVGLIRHRLARLETRVSAEALERKLPGERGLSPVDYLVRTEGLSAPAPAPRDAARVVRLAEASRDSQGHVGAVMSAFDQECLSASKADTLVRFHHEAEALSDPGAHSEVMGILTREATDRHLPTEQYGMMGRAGERVAGLSDRELQIATRRAMRTIKAAEDLAKDEQIARNGRTLHSQQWDNGMSEYRLVLDPESAAIVDAAISGLSAPTPVDGVPDSRSAAQRRADALVMIVQRGVSAPGKVPKTEKAQVMVTISYEDLLNQLRGAGVTMTGQILSPQTVRRMACEAGIIPTILGTQGEILDIGRLSRLFTPGQRRALWHRDKGCTFKDCTMPAPWCEAHHIIYWSNGGATDISNGALLCPRHHTHVHQHDLIATVTPTGVTWHT